MVCLIVYIIIEHIKGIWRPHLEEKEYWFDTFFKIISKFLITIEKIKISQLFWTNVIKIFKSIKWVYLCWRDGSASKA